MIIVERRNGPVQSFRAAPSSGVTATYKGERLLFEQRVDTSFDGKSYKYAFTREMPIMTFSLDSDPTVFERDLATWAPFGVEITSSSKPTASAKASRESMKLGPMAMEALAFFKNELKELSKAKPEASKKGFNFVHPQPGGSSGRSGDYGFNPSPRGPIRQGGGTHVPSDSATTGSANDLISFGVTLVVVSAFIGASMVASAVATIGGKAITKLDNELTTRAKRFEADQKARIAAGSGGGGGSAGGADTSGPKKPHAPGWPASNFRKGKGKGKASASKKSEDVSTEPSVMRVNMKAGYTAPFDIGEGEAKLLPSIALSVVIFNEQDLAIWETGDIHVPLQSKKTAIPVEVQWNAAASLLLAEAQAYTEFLAAEPDLTVAVKDE